MDNERKLALVNASLERAAELLGDVTAPVFELYYARCPEGRQSFLTHDPQGRTKLEGTMVEQALYCLMRWHECPGEIEIILVTTIPHHIETLDVSIDEFAALLTAASDVITATIPPEAAEERAVWDEMLRELLAICTESAKYAIPRSALRAA